MIEKYNRIFLVIILVIAIAFSSCANSGENNCESIVNELTSDEYSGRLTGTDGNIKAAKYIAQLYEEIGLEFLFADSYYQNFETECIDPEQQEPEITIYYTDGTKEELVQGKDYVIQQSFSDIEGSFSFVRWEENGDYENSIFISDDISSEENTKYKLYAVP